MADEKDKTLPGSLTARFQRFLAPIEGAECLRWTGTKHHRTGHGIFQVAPGVNWAVSRVAYVMAHAEPLAASQSIEPTCATGKLCAEGRHWVLSKKSRRRPAHVKRYSRQAREELTQFALRLGPDDVARLFGVERRNLVRWVRAHRRALNGTAEGAQAR